MDKRQEDTGPPLRCGIVDRGPCRTQRGKPWRWVRAEQEVGTPALQARDGMGVGPITGARTAPRGLLGTLPGVPVQQPAAQEQVPQSTHLPRRAQIPQVSLKRRMAEEPHIAGAQVPQSRGATQGTCAHSEQQEAGEGGLGLRQQHPGQARWPCRLSQHWPGWHPNRKLPALLMAIQETQMGLQAAVVTIWGVGQPMEDLFLPPSLPLSLCLPTK